MAPKYRRDTPVAHARAPEEAAPASLHIELYDADGWDRSISLEEIDVERLQEQQLLWVDLAGQDPALVEQLVRRMHCRPSW